VIDIHTSWRSDRLYEDLLKNTDKAPFILALTSYRNSIVRSTNAYAA
jgi:hypothetical protein